MALALEARNLSWPVGSASIWSAPFFSLTGFCLTAATALRERAAVLAGHGGDLGDVGGDVLGVLAAQAERHFVAQLAGITPWVFGYLIQ